MGSKRCEVCGRIAHARGLCAKHYAEHWRRGQDPSVERPSALVQAERCYRQATTLGARLYWRRKLERLTGKAAIPYVFKVKRR